MTIHSSKSYRRRKSLLEQQLAESLHNRLRELETPEQKRELIAESNPLLYLFGTVLNPNNYLNEVDAQAQGEYYED